MQQGSGTTAAYQDLRHSLPAALLHSNRYCYCHHGEGQDATNSLQQLLQEDSTALFFLLLLSLQQQLLSLIHRCDKPCQPTLAPAQPPDLLLMLAQNHMPASSGDACTTGENGIHKHANMHAVCLRVLPAGQPTSSGSSARQVTF
jgi:hypothetical protein